MILQYIGKLFSNTYNWGFNKVVIYRIKENLLDRIESNTFLRYEYSQS